MVEKIEVLPGENCGVVEVFEGFELSMVFLSGLWCSVDMLGALY